MTTGSVSPLSGWQSLQLFSPSVYDVVQIAGATSPGLVRLSGFARKWKWDKKGGKGAQGITPTMTGKDECSGTFTFFLFNGLDFVLWEGFRPLFKYDPTKTTTQAVSVFHPALQDLDISQLFCEEISPILPVQGRGDLFTCEVKMSEFTKVPQAAAVGTPTQAKSGASSSPNPSAPAPTDPLQIKIQSLLTQLSAP